MKNLIFSLAVGLVMMPALFAHHGSEFITLDNYDIGHAGDGTLNASFDFERFGDADEISSEFDLFYSPLSRVGLGLTVRFAEDGRGDWVYSSVTPRVQIQLTDPIRRSVLRLGMTFGYQFAEDLSYDETTTTFEDVVIRKPKTTRQVTTVLPTADSGGGEAACNPLLDLDCEPVASRRTAKHSGSHAPVVTGTSTTTVSSGGETEVQRVATTTTTRKGVSSHQGIHDHDSRQWFGRLIVETEVGRTKVTGNIIGTCRKMIMLTGVTGLGRVVRWLRSWLRVSSSLGISLRVASTRRLLLCTIM